MLCCTTKRLLFTASIMYLFDENWQSAPVYCIWASYEYVCNVNQIGSSYIVLNIILLYTI